jgi:DNA-binding beta-propeller fold protein YncE
MRRAVPEGGYSPRMRIVAAAVLVSALACAQAGDPAPGAKDAPLELVQTIPLAGVAGRIDHMDVDAKRKRLVVAALGNGTVEVVGLEKGERVKTFGGLEEPQGVAYLPDVDRIVVACGGDGSVRFHDGGTFAETARVALGSDADNVRFDPVMQRVFVGYGDGAVASIPAGKPAAVGKADVGAHPEAFALETAGRRLFVNAEGAAEVVVIDRFDMTVKARWKLGGARANFPMALDEAGKRLYVGCRAPASLVVLATDDGRVVSRTDCSSDPDDVFVDAKRNRVYVSAGAGAVDVFERPDVDHLKLLAKVETRRGARTSFFDAVADRLYVAVPKDGSKDAEIRIYAPK